MTTATATRRAPLQAQTIVLSTEDVVSLPAIPLSYDYSQVDEAHRERVMSAARAIKQRDKQAAKNIVEIGLALLDVQARLEHGQFLPWIEAEFDWQKSMAYNFMNVAEKFPTVGNLENFGLAALYVLSAPSVPGEVLIEANEMAAAGVKVTKKIAKALVDKAKPPKSPTVIDLTPTPTQQAPEPSQTLRPSAVPLAAPTMPSAPPVVTATLFAKPPTRQERVACLLAHFRQTINDLGEYGDLVGDYTGPTRLRRELEPMILKLEAIL